MADSSNTNKGIGGRVRSASISLMNANPQVGMWQAAGTVIAQAPNLTELRVSELSEGLEFNAQGYTAHTAVRKADGELVPIRTVETLRSLEEEGREQSPGPPRRTNTLHEKYRDEPKEKWGPTIVNGLKALGKFCRTPVGFCIMIYFLNIVAMLFFLLLGVAPAMNYPNADDDNSPRKKWLEIDSQILNALFCVTGFGLAFWRFRDLYYFIRVVSCKDKDAMQRLATQNKGWFRPPAWARDDETLGSEPSTEKHAVTFTGNVAPPTALWKLAFNIIMMVLNTIIQCVLSYYMWAYNRLERPTWATGTFIGLGCGVAMFAGIMSWWEGRKVKKIEGPEVKIVDTV